MKYLIVVICLFICGCKSNKNIWVNGKPGWNLMINTPPIKFANKNIWVNGKPGWNLVINIPPIQTSIIGNGDGRHMTEVYNRKKRIYYKIHD